MKIRQIMTIAILIISAIIGFACTSETPKNTNTEKMKNANVVPSPTVTPAVNVNANVANTNTSAANVTAPTTSAAPNSPSAVLMAYYNALKNNDEAALRKTLSPDAIKEWEADTKEAGFATIVENINDYGEPPAQIKGEKIEGNVAIVETFNPQTKISGKYELINEGDGWKISPPSRIGLINQTPGPRGDSK